MSIQITPEIRAYAMAVAAVGERMKKTARKFGEVSQRPTRTIEEMKRKKDDYKKLYKEFESQEETLLKLNVPSELREEHSMLFASFNKYVISTEHAISSLDVENVKTNEKLLDESQKLQWEASREIVQISNEMAKKLGI